MKDVTVLSMRPSGGRRLVLRHRSSLHRVQVLPVGRNPRTPDEELGWLPLLLCARSHRERCTPPTIVPQRETQGVQI